jgi:tRNA G18 (ribose-2'-O)-methylase SpoU
MESEDESFMLACEVKQSSVENSCPETKYLRDPTTKPMGKPLLYNVHSTLQTIPNHHVKEFAKAQAIPLALLLFNLDGNMNVGMILRTAVVFGCSTVYLVGKKRYDPRSTVGAKNYITIHYVPSIDDPITFFDTKNLQPILLEQGGEPLETFSFAPYIKESTTKLPTIVLGCESKGIPSEWLSANLGPTISISQMGVLRSLNVSIAGSVILYEYMKQWREYSMAKLHLL